MVNQKAPELVLKIPESFTVLISAAIKPSIPKE